MLAEERFSQILALLAEKRTATVQELCEALNVSESTIRRDLLELDRQGRVNKVHGGATLPSSQFRADEPTMEAKETLAVSQKNTIAKAAAALIQADDFVYLDAGSTTLAVARAVSGAALDAHYVTNGIAHARLLAQKGCRVFVPGGLLRPQTEAIIGAAAMAALQQYNFTKAFLGANGIDLVAGVSTFLFLYDCLHLFLHIHYDRYCKPLSACRLLFRLYEYNHIHIPCSVHSPRYDLLY